MGDYTPVNNVDTFTMTTSAAVTGGQLVTASGAGTVAPSTTGDHSIGVALFDAPSGGRVTVAFIPVAVHETTVQGTTTITAGGPVSAGTTGTVVASTTSMATAAAAGLLLGIALTTATGGTGTGKVRWIGV